MSLNQQILQRSDAIILRSQPRVRKPRSQAVKVVLSSGPLSVIQIKTAKGEVAYQFMARSRKYAYEDDFRRLVCSLFRYLYPEKEENKKARSQRYLQRNRQKERQRSSRYYQEHRLEQVMKARQRRAKQP